MTRSYDYIIIVRQLANNILEKFLKKTVILNIISLAKTKEVIAEKSNITNDGNHYLE